MLLQNELIFTMIEQVKIILNSYDLTNFQVSVIILLILSFLFIIKSLYKVYIENYGQNLKINAQHVFEERKKIKAEISKYKTHLLNTCEDVNHRFLNLREHYSHSWLKLDRNYKDKEKYYFHSTIYRFLCLYFWIKKAQKEIFYLDTTIASKEDLEFITFLKIFPNIMCDLDYIIGPSADQNSEDDHFFRNIFESFPDFILDNGTPKSFEKYIEDLPNLKISLEKLYIYFDGITPTENRLRWDRIHFLHLTIILFLNNYGYDFQKTDQKNLKEILSGPKKSSLLNNYLKYLKKYNLLKNKEVKQLINLSKRL